MVEFRVKTLLQCGHGSETPGIGFGFSTEVAGNVVAYASSHKSKTYSQYQFKISQTHILLQVVISKKESQHH